MSAALPFEYTSIGPRTDERVTPSAHASGRACSPSHIGPLGSLTTFVGGTTVELRGRKPNHGQRPSYRGKIRTYSRRARSRFLCRLGQIDRTRLPSHCYFVTLTYPGEYSPDPIVWRRHLKAWVKRLERRYGLNPFFWRLEAQRRGAPHWHLVWLGSEAIDPDWLSKSWYEVVGSGDPRHLRAGTQRKRLRNWKQLAQYVSKYAAKYDADQIAGFGGLPVGRWWGVRRGELLPVSPVTVELTGETFHRVRRVLRGVAKARGRNWPTGRRLAGGWTYLESDDQGRLLLYAASFDPPCLVECAHGWGAGGMPDVPGLPTGVPYEESWVGWPELRALDGVADGGADGRYQLAAFER